VTKLKLLVESARRRGILNSETLLDDLNRNYSGRDPNKPTDDVLDAIKYEAPDEEFFSMVEQCRPIVIVLGDDRRDKKIIFDSKEEINIDSPFDVFSVEYLRENDVYNVRVVSFVVEVACILAKEISPRNFVYYSLVRTIPNKSGPLLPNGRDFVEFVIKSYSGKNNEFLSAALASFLESINKNMIGAESVRETIKIGRGSEKRIHRIRRIVHVAPKSYIKSNPESHRNVDWSHRFEVRGHWRKVDTIGKDREENYTVNGYTWVKHHTRGPEELPLIKKTRLVDNCSNHGAVHLPSFSSHQFV
jgi:hypothetical protein